MQLVALSGETYMIFPLNSFPCLLPQCAYDIKLRSLLRRSDLYSSDDPEFLSAERRWKKPWTPVKCSAIVAVFCLASCLLSQQSFMANLTCAFRSCCLHRGQYDRFGQLATGGFFGHVVLPLALHSSISMSTVLKMSLYILQF